MFSVPAIPLYAGPFICPTLLMLMPFSPSALLRLTALSLSLLLASSLHAAPAVTPNAKQKSPKKKTPAVAPQDGEFANFGQWREVAAFIDDMVARNGFDRKELNKVFSKTRYVDSAVRLMKPAPPGKPKNWTAYRLRFVEPVRINAGVQFWNRYEGELARAEEVYGVPAEIIVAIIGVETIYGGNTGNFRVMDAITTLAFDYPNTPTREARMQFFRGELENTLLFARESHIDPFSLLGSYAGAIGLPQFMPSSIRQYAVDFNGDGKIDLRNEPVDAIGSVAHFLSVHGWRRGLPLAVPVNAPADDAAAQAWLPLLDKGLNATYSMDDIKAAGLTPAFTPVFTPVFTPPSMPASVPVSATVPGPTQVDATAITGPADNAVVSEAGVLKYGLVDLQNGNGPTEYWLGTDNFFAITKYNRSYFYAMSVVDLGRTIKAARAK
jgi:membrane-bound lytic murein transglycosylase B